MSREVAIKLHNYRRQRQARGEVIRKLRSMLPTTVPSSSASISTIRARSPQILRSDLIDRASRLSSNWPRTAAGKGRPGPLQQVLLNLMMNRN
jgi:hypothetical protein